MRVFKTKWFARFARKEKITDRALREAVRRVERGLVDADLGGGVIKQRLARSGQGKSGGYRTVMIYQRRKRAIFVFAFAKSGRADLYPEELEGHRELAKIYMAKSEAEMTGYVAAGVLVEVRDHDKEG